MLSVHPIPVTTMRACIIACALLVSVGCVEETPAPDPPPFVLVDKEWPASYMALCTMPPLDAWDDFTEVEYERISCPEDLDCLLGFWLPEFTEGRPGRYGRCVAYCHDGCDAVPSDSCEGVQGRDAETDELTSFGVCGHGRKQPDGSRCVNNLNCVGTCDVGGTFLCI